MAEMASQLQQMLPSLAKKGPLSEGDMWVLQGRRKAAVFQGVHAQEWVPGSAVASLPLAPLGVPTRGLQGQPQVHILWDSTKSAREQIIAEGRANARAGGQTFLAIPASNAEALETQGKGTRGRQLVRRLGTLEGWKWKKEAAEGAAEASTEDGGCPVKRKGKKEKVLLPPSHKE